MFYAQDHTPEKRHPGKKKVASEASRIEMAPLIPDILMEGKPQCYHDLHQALMLQPAGTRSYSIAMGDIFHHKDDTEICIALSLDDIIDLYMDDWASVQLIQIWCLYVLSKPFCQLIAISYVHNVCYKMYKMQVMQKNFGSGR